MFLDSSAISHCAPFETLIVIGYPALSNEADWLLLHHQVHNS